MKHPYPTSRATIFNYTPHSVNLLRPDGSLQERFESVGVARCKEFTRSLPPLYYDPFGDGGMTELVSIVSKSFGEVEGLPAFDPAASWRMYIVSQIVADALPNRDDLLVPSGVLRDARGEVLGCSTFSWRAKQ